MQPAHTDVGHGPALAAPTTDDGAACSLTLPALFLSFRLLLQAAAAGLAAGHHQQPAADVIETGKRLVNPATTGGQDLRTLMAAAVAGLVLVPAAVAALQAITRSRQRCSHRA